VPVEHLPFALLHPGFDLLNHQVVRVNPALTVLDDAQYSRVLVSGDAFERMDFSPGGSGPANDDFPPDGPTMGRVTTRAGRRLASRLVFDLGESEVTDTLDAPSEGVDYTLSFCPIASIEPPDPAECAEVTLHSEKLLLKRLGDRSVMPAGSSSSAARDIPSTRPGPTSRGLTSTSPRRCTRP
jgi:hypothetical protein